MQFSEKLLSSYFLSRNIFSSYNLIYLMCLKLLYWWKKSKIFLTHPSANKKISLYFLYCWPEPHINIFIFSLFQRLWKRKKKKMLWGNNKSIMWVHGNKTNQCKNEDFTSWCWCVRDFFLLHYWWLFHGEVEKRENF